MSRIDDALRRAEGARAGGDRSPRSTPGGGPKTPPETGPFQSAWELPVADEQAEADGSALRTPRENTAPRDTRSIDAPSEAAPLLAEHGPGTLALFKGFHPGMTERLALPTGGHGGLVEQFRKLAATLHHAQAASGIRTVLITSSVTGEGKTLTSTNLALTLAESYRRRVLLVDADLRRPSLHEVFQVPNVSGLSDGLESEEDHRLSVLHVSSMLKLLTAGRPLHDPMGALTSPRMRRILEEAREAFDWVVIDTPPVGMLTDANLLSRMADASVLVVAAGRTPYGLVQKAVDVLGRERLVGIVLNRVEPEDQPHGETEYAYYAYYGYGYRK